MNFIACAQCSNAMFCSRWNANAMDLPIQHIVRSIFIALNMFPNIASSSKEIFKQYSCLMWFPVMKDLFDSPRKQRFLMHLCGQHICAINSNAFFKIWQSITHIHHSILLESFMHSEFVTLQMWTYNNLHNYSTGCEGRTIVSVLFGS